MGVAGAMYVSFLPAIYIFKQLLLCSFLIEIKLIYYAYKHLKKYNILHIVHFHYIINKTAHDLLGL